jgi:hypothetical protein
MYSGIKDADPYIKLFFLTGLTKILKLNIFSAINNLSDISYDPLVYDLVGYTWADIEKNFSEEIVEMAEKEKMPTEKLKEKIKLYYNGYNFGNSEDTIFNPWNINNFFLKKDFQFYWSNTGIPSAIVDYIKAKNINVVELTEKIENDELLINEVSLKLEYLDKILPEVFFYNGGYLTIKDASQNIYLLDYPNLETKMMMNQFFLEL